MTVPVSADLTPEQVADKVVHTVVSFIAANPPMWQNWKQQKNNKALDFAAMVRYLHFFAIVSIIIFNIELLLELFLLCYD